jgi:hypothetical protein
MTGPDNENEEGGSSPPRGQGFLGIGLDIHTHSLCDLDSGCAQSSITKPVGEVREAWQHFRSLHAAKEEGGMVDGVQKTLSDFRQDEILKQSKQFVEKNMAAPVH